mmetsp:Transcript_117316/g.250685  ORF Transcript_117316/g.250685 Transcript_117316/m.250685 type:complete len:217 (-) Transcript_117316:2-652(-)
MGSSTPSSILAWICRRCAILVLRALRCSGSFLPGFRTLWNCATGSSPTARETSMRGAPSVWTRRSASADRGRIRVAIRRGGARAVAGTRGDLGDGGRPRPSRPASVTSATLSAGGTIGGGTEGSMSWRASSGMVYSRFRKSDWKRAVSAFRVISSSTLARRSAQERTVLLCSSPIVRFTRARFRRSSQRCSMWTSASAISRSAASAAAAAETSGAN